MLAHTCLYALAHFINPQPWWFVEERGQDLGVISPCSGRNYICQISLNIPKHSMTGRQTIKLKFSSFSLSFRLKSSD